MCFEMKNILKNNNHYHTFKHNKKNKVEPAPRNSPQLPGASWEMAPSYLIFVFYL
jgi:hypothetical protein